MTKHIYQEVLDTCKELYRERGWKEFSPQHLVDMEGVGNLEEVDQICNAFSFLNTLGYFYVSSIIVDKDGKTIVEGLPVNWSKDEVEKAREAIKDPNCFIAIGYSATEKFISECDVLID